MDWSGEGYAGISALQKWLAEESLAHVDWSAGETVLDLGCGDGKITAQIAGRVAQAVGVDYSQSMIDFARQHHRAENLSFEQGDARTYRSQGAFDRVVSFNALHWVKECDQPQSFATVASLLKPGGVAHLRMVGAGPIRSLEDVLESVRRLPHWQPFFADFQQPFCHPTVAQCREWAEGAGLELQSSRCDLKEWDFGSRAEFQRWGQTTFVNWAGNCPAERRAEFVSEVVDHYDSTQVFRFYQLQLELVKKPVRGESSRPFPG